MHSVRDAGPEEAVRGRVTGSPEQKGSADALCAPACTTNLALTLSPESSVTLPPSFAALCHLKQVP